MRYSFFLFIAMMAALAAAEDLSVVQAIPRGELGNIDQAASIQVVFNEPVRALKALDQGDPKGFFVISPEKKGRLRWKGAEVFEFVPESPLSLGTEYTIIVPKGMKSEVTGKTLRADYSFTLITPRPSVQSVDPRPIRKGEEQWYRPLGLREPITLYFNQPVLLDSIERYVSIAPPVPLAFSDEIAPAGKSRKPSGAAASDRTGETGKRRSRAVTVRPKDSWQRATTYDIVCRAGLPGSGGPLGMKEDFGFRFATFERFTLAGFEFNQKPLTSGGIVDPFGTITVKFSNRVVKKELLRRLRFNPESPFDQEALESTDESAMQSLSLGLKPATRYTLTVGRGITDIYGNTLDSEVVLTFTTADYHSYLKTLTGHGLIEAKGPHLFPVEITNVDSIRFSFKKLLPDEMVRLIMDRQQLYGNESFETADFGPWTRRLTVAGPSKRNERVRYPVSLDSVLGGRPGAVFSEMADTTLNEYTHRETMYHKALFQVTDLGITAKFGYDNSLIAVTSLESGLKKANVDVEIRSESNLVVWKGKTGADGLVLAPSWRELGLKARQGGAPHAFVFAREADDWSCLYSQWGTGIEPYRFTIPFSWSKIPEIIYKGTVISERDLYRPGETVYCKGIVRYLAGGYWSNPRHSEIELKLYQGNPAYGGDPEEEGESEGDGGRVVFQNTFTLSKLGSFEFKYKIPDDAKLYTYYWVGRVKGFKDSTESWLESRQDIGGMFRVAEFRPAELDVAVHIGGENYLCGDNVAAHVSAAYLHGAPVAAAGVEVKVSKAPYYFNPKGHEGYSFDDRWSRTDESWFGGGEGEEEQEDISARSSVVWSTSATLDKQGCFTATVPLQAGSCGACSRYQCEATVQGNTMQPVCGAKAFFVHPARFYIGLKPKTQFGEERGALPIYVRTVDAEGGRVAIKGITVEIIRRVWNSVRKAEVDGRFHWVTDKADSVCFKGAVATSVKGFDSVAFVPALPGYYIVKAHGTDDRGRAVAASSFFYVTGGASMAWARSDDDRIELVADKKRYSPGETATIMVKSPYKEADALVTVEREGILDKQWVRLRGTADRIVLPVKKEFLPNVFVSVMLIKGRLAPLAFDERGDDLSKPSFKMGYVKLSVNPKQNNLGVKVSPQRDKYRPQDSVSVKIAIPALAGRKYGSEALVMAVDEGVLILSRFKTPDPFAFFYRERALCVATAESRLSVIGQRNYGEKGKNRGGGGGFNPDLLASLTGIKPRGTFKTCAYFNPRVIVDKNGEAAVSFKLPDNITTFRIMAIAHTAMGEFGSGEAKITVNKNLMVRPQLPRFARCGDSFKAAAFVENRTSQAGELSAALLARNAAISGPAAVQVKMEKDQTNRLSFPTAAPPVPDSMTFTFSGRLGAETDAVELSIPCIFERRLETVAQRGTTEDKDRQKVVIPENTWERLGKVETRVSSTALVGLGDGVNYLFEYPYGCLEQRTSCVLPLLLFEDMVRAFGIKTLKNGDAASVIREYLASLEKYRTPEGGFDYWSPAMHTSPFISAYAMLAMIKAKKKGYAVDAQLKKGCRNYLEGVLNGTIDPRRFPYPEDAWLTTEAFICGVLAEDGYYDANTIERLYKRVSGISTFGQIFLFRAVALGNGSPDIGKGLRTVIENSLKLEAAAAFLAEPMEGGWIHTSSVRSTAAMLIAFLEAEGSCRHADKMVNWLMQQQRQGRWKSTQENLYSFWALAEYFNRYEKAEPDFKAQVKIDGASWFEELFKGRRSDQIARVRGLDEFKAGKECFLEFSKSGRGRLYYELRMSYAPKAALPKRDEGFGVERSYASMDGKKIDPGRLKNGEYVIVTVTVTTPRDRNFVVVNDPIPAGCEIVDPGAASADKSVVRLVEGKNAYHSDGDWWGSWNHTEYRDQRCLLFADFMTAGAHSFTYALRTIVSGTFYVPAAYAEAMYNPEIFGRGEECTAIVE